MKVFAIVNERAGGGRGIPEALALLAEAGFDVLRASDGLAASAIAKRCLALNPDLIVAVGGDGTVATIGNALLASPETNTALGIIPMGTGNDLARTLGIPLDARAALDVLKAGHRRRIDVAEVSSSTGQNFMLNMATGGSSTEITRQTSSELKRIWKAFAYLISSWKYLGKQRSFRVRAVVDGKQVPMKALNVMVANGRTAGGGFVIAPDAVIDDGQLDFVVVKPARVVDLLRMVLKLIFRRLKDDRNLFESRCRELEIDATPSFALSVDGEVSHKTPVKFRVLERTLAVIAVPFDDTR